MGTYVSMGCVFGGHTHTRGGSTADRPTDYSRRSSPNPSLPPPAPNPAYRNGRLAASYYHVSLFDVPPDYWAQVTDALSSPGQSQGQSQGQQQQQPPLASSAARAGSGVGEGGEGAVAVVGLMQRLSLGGGKGESLLEGE